MTKSCLLPLLAASLLLSCSTGPKVDALEARARDGDLVAACQLIARSLRDCALERQSWETSKVGLRPACIGEGISDRQMGYLDKAGDKLSALDQVLLVGPRVQFLVAYVTLVTGPADKAVQQAGDAQERCDRLAEDLTR